MAREDLHAQGRRRHAPGCCTAAASARTRRAPTPTARSTKPSPRSGSPAPRPSAGRSSTSSWSASSASCSWSAPSWRPRPRTAPSSTPGVSRHHRRDGRRARADHRRHHRPATSRRPSSCCRARTASPPRSTSRARSCAAPSGRRSPPRTPAGSTDSQVVPYLNRLADLVYTLARWQEGTLPSRPHRAPMPDLRDPPETLRRPSCPSRSPSRPPPPTASRPTCSRCPSRKGADARARRRRRRRRARRRARRVPRRGRLRGQARARRSRCRPAGGSGRRPRCSWASAIPTSSPLDGVRRAAAASPAARRRSRRSRPRSPTRRAGARPAPMPRRRSPRACVLGAYQFLEYKGDGDAVEAEEGDRLGDGGARGRRPRSTRGATVGDAVTWARDLVNTPVEATSRRPTWSPSGAQAAARHAASPCRCSTCGSCRRSGSAACSASARARSSRRGSSR